MQFRLLKPIQLEIIGIKFSDIYSHGKGGKRESRRSTNFLNGLLHCFEVICFQLRIKYILSSVLDLLFHRFQTHGECLDTNCKIQLDQIIHITKICLLNFPNCSFRSMISHIAKHVLRWPCRHDWSIEIPHLSHNIPNIAPRRHTSWKIILRITIIMIIIIIRKRNMVRRLVLLTWHILHIFQPNLLLDHLGFHFFGSTQQSALNFLKKQVY